jgi:hypothetical protein
LAKAMPKHNAFYDVFYTDMKFLENKKNSTTNFINVLDDNVSQDFEDYGLYGVRVVNIPLVKFLNKSTIINSKYSLVLLDCRDPRALVLFKNNEDFINDWIVRTSTKVIYLIEAEDEKHLSHKPWVEAEIILIDLCNYKFVKTMSNFKDIFKSILRPGKDSSDRTRIERKSIKLLNKLSELEEYESNAIVSKLISNNSTS